MNKFVLDCPIATAWRFEDEVSEVIDSLLERVRDRRAVVHSLWFLGITNVLLQAEWSNRITVGDVATRLRFLQLLPISIKHLTQAECI